MKGHAVWTAEWTADHQASAVVQGLQYCESPSICYYIRIAVLEITKHLPLYYDCSTADHQVPDVGIGGDGALDAQPDERHVNSSLVSFNSVLYSSSISAQEHSSECSFETAKSDTSCVLSVESEYNSPDSYSTDAASSEADESPSSNDDVLVPAGSGRRRSRQKQ
ncbi:hypothetical protein QYM36_002246, partial [Artemia franciscana]